MSDFCSYLPSTKKKTKSTTPVKKESKDTFSFLNTTSKPLVTTPKKKEKVVVKPKKSFNRKDIFLIDLHIKEILLEKIQNLDYYSDELETMIWITESGNEEEETQAKIEIKKLRQTIKNLEFGIEYGYYLLRTEDILTQYRRIFKKESNQFLILQKEEKDPNEERREELLDKFISIARSYVEIEYEPNSKKIKCSNCKSTEIEENEEECIKTCKGCGYTMDILDETPSFKDTDRINMSSKYKYSLVGRFLDTMKKYQGKQSKNVDGVLSIIKKEMRSHNISKEELHKDHIYLFLQKEKLTNHFEDINLIHSRITGVPAPDISMYEKTLLDLFNIQENAYSLVKDPDRDNSLSVLYKLYKLLQKIGFDVRREDFYFLRTPTKEEEHDDKMLEVWNHLGWDWIPT